MCGGGHKQAGPILHAAAGEPAPRRITAERPKRARNKCRLHPGLGSQELGMGPGSLCPTAECWTAARSHKGPLSPQSVCPSLWAHTWLGHQQENSLRLYALCQPRSQSIFPPGTSFNPHSSHRREAGRAPAFPVNAWKLRPRGLAIRAHPSRKQSTGCGSHTCPQFAVSCTHTANKAFQTPGEGDPTRAQPGARVVRPSPLPQPSPSTAAG